MGETADRYLQILQKKRAYLYNLMPIHNIPSVMKNGIVCHELAEKICHTSIAMEKVQKIRSKVVIPNGLRLHQYANLYFSARNPMMFKRKDRAQEFCVLAVSTDVLDLDDCIVSDRNAASGFAKFEPASIGIEHIDFEKVFAQSWIHEEDEISTWNHKAIKCAEVLIPRKIPYHYVLGAYVVDDTAQTKLQQVGFDKKIVVYSKMFFWR